MSRQLPGEQVEHAFAPGRLCNWETPRVDAKVITGTLGSSRFGTLRPRDGRTVAIVDERGHLLPGVYKLKNAFTNKVPVYSKSPARWPQENVAYKTAARATMGYKGIQTDYLPTSTVTLRTVDIQGSKETNYSFR